MYVSGQLHAPGKEPWYPVDTRLGGPQSQPEHGGKKKINK